MKADNELIAEFMDCIGKREVGPLGGDMVLVYRNAPVTGWFNADCRQLGYDKSWDWLMPVVEKIEEEISKISHNTPYDSAFNGTVNTDIQVAYCVVVEFIHWYNAEVKRK